MKIILIFFMFLHLGGNLNLPPKYDHALYLAVIQLKQNPQRNTAQINIKVFTDDLQSALRNEFSDYKPVLENELCEKRGEFIQPYFSKHFSIQINDGKEKLSLKNCKKEGDVYWLEFEINCPEKWKNMSVEADFFMELFPTQSNVLSVEIGEEKRYCRLTKKKEFCETEF